MISRAKGKYYRVSPSKVRKVIDLIRGKDVSSSLAILTHTNKGSTDLIAKVLNSAIANAEHNDGADIDELKVSTIFVDAGPTLKRIKTRSKGRADRMFKRSCHITVKVSDN